MNHFDHAVTESRTYSTKNAFPYYVQRRDYDWMQGDFVKYVVFTHFDQTAQMSVEIMVHWTKAFEYLACRAPGYHTIQSVITEKGLRMHTTTYTASTVNEEEWMARPLILKGAFSINLLGSRQCLMEIKGGRDYAYNQRRDAAALEAFIRRHDNQENQKNSES